MKLRTLLLCHFYVPRMAAFSREMDVTMEMCMVCSPWCPLGHAKDAGGSQQLVVVQRAGKTQDDLQGKTHQSREKPPKVKASLLDET